MSNWPQQRPTSTIKRPQKPLRKWGMLENICRSSTAFFWRSAWYRRVLYYRYISLIHKKSQSLSSLHDKELMLKIQRLRQQLLRHGYCSRYLCDAFALIREVAGRRLGMYHFDSQLMGALSLFFGNLSEMQAGEGKTLTAVLPAAAAAIAGIPVHVITVNDYLVARDTEQMRPVYEMLGLSVGMVIHGMSLKQRQQAYACDIIYCTSKELVFDYLKDHLVMKGCKHSLSIYSHILQGRTDIVDRLMQRGLHYAIIDEADSILLDESRTPLIISGETLANKEQEKVYYQASKLANLLEKNKHYLLDAKKRLIKITLLGEQFVKEVSRDWGHYWTGSARRLELAQQALSALLFFEKDKHYLVRDGKVQIIDEHTGRIMEDRSWEKGLHQLIEIKERCELTRPRKTLAQISYQRFFRMYHRLSGMSGTASEASIELWSIYNLTTIIIPSHRRSRRINLSSRLFDTVDEKWKTVIARIVAVHREGRPVLVGTISVKVSDYLSGMLSARKVKHRVLNAKQDKHEADIISEAGQAGKITIATNMAGRGTDIKLATTAKEKGGLHVILTEFHEASRIDRQLQGRCARMGDPGSFEAILSLEDSLITNEKYGGIKSLLSLPLFRQTAIGRRLKEYCGIKLLRYAQSQLEKQHEVSRRELLSLDQKQSEILSFTSSNF